MKGKIVGTYECFPHGRHRPKIHISIITEDGELHVLDREQCHVPIIIFDTVGNLSWIKNENGKLEKIFQPVKE